MKQAAIQLASRTILTVRMTIGWMARMGTRGELRALIRCRPQDPGSEPPLDRVDCVERNPKVC